jgi:hypothetical protein
MSGHPLKTPDGRDILVDRDCLVELQKKKLLNGHRTRIKQIILSRSIQSYLSVRLRNHLGLVRGNTRITGPEVCICNCSLCKQR